MATVSPTLIRASAPFARAAVSLVQRPSVRNTAQAVMQEAGLGGHAAMLPAAVRVERARSRRNGETAEQTAVTMWFGRGPDLPSPGGSSMRSAARLSAGVLGAAALAALTAVAARREETRGTIVEAPARPRGR